MKNLLLAAVMLMPFAAQADDAPAPLKLSITYTGPGQYLFEKSTYDYGDLLAAIRAEYADQHVTSISVDMGDGSLMGDRLSICRLKLDTGAQVMLHFRSDGQKHDLYCS
ncbi:MAG TPA: hypothetical protein VKT74_00940 [Gammaproteobacteria bacterium]|nr:hypothetical protein [Gammaproteobacteria bacterium]